MHDEHQTPNSNINLAEIVEVLNRIELACDAIAAARTTEQYLSMIDGGQEDLLSELGDARQAARDMIGRFNLLAHCTKNKRCTKRSATR